MKSPIHRRIFIFAPPRSRTIFAYRVCGLVEDGIGWGALVAYPLEKTYVSIVYRPVPSLYSVQYWR